MPINMTVMTLIVIFDTIIDLAKEVGADYVFLQQALIAQDHFTFKNFKSVSLEAKYNEMKGGSRLLHRTVSYFIPLQFLSTI